MKKTVLALATMAMTLGGCGGPAEPVVLPDDAIEAARTCFVAQGMVLREGKGEGEAVTYAEFADSIKYALAATAGIEPFTTDNVGKVFTGVDPVMEELSGKDYAGAIATCDARFEAKGEVTLPEDDADAVLGCLTLSAFMQGAAQSAVAEFGADGSKVGPLYDRLQARMTSDPDVLVKLISDTEATMNEATRGAFAQGNPRAYLDLCEARFPAE